MAEAGEETAAQRQARIRREKREAKIKAGGSERLDKITKLSGRTPESMRNDYPSPSSSPAPQASRPVPAAPPSMPPPMSNSDDPALLQAQQEYIRSLLRAQDSQPGQPGQEQRAEDPMVKMLNSLLGGADGTDPATPGGLPFSPEDISKATGLPPFLTNMFVGQENATPTPAQEQTVRIWALVHILFSLLAGIYVVHTLTSSTSRFGANPPPPATIRNPFLVFMMGELLVQSTQMFLVDRAGRKGIWAWWQILKDIARDGSIVIFMMGATSWLKGLV